MERFFPLESTRRALDRLARRFGGVSAKSAKHEARFIVNNIML